MAFRHNKKNFIKGIGMSNPIILMETSSGDILLELFEDKAPVSAANFLKYVDIADLQLKILIHF